MLGVSSSKRMLPRICMVGATALANLAADGIIPEEYVVAEHGSLGRLAELLGCSYESEQFTTSADALWKLMAGAQAQSELAAAKEHALQCAFAKTHAVICSFAMFLASSRSTLEAAAAALCSLAESKNK